MRDTASRLTSTPGGRLNLAVLLAGAMVMAWSLVAVAGSGPAREHGALLLVAVPVIVVMARFPVILEGRDSARGVEIGFDSSILMFLLSTVPAREAVLVWCLGVLATQLSSGKRASAVVFNIGVGCLAAGTACGVFVALRGPGVTTPRELLAIALAAACYFMTDYLLSAVAVALEDGSSVSRSLNQRGAVPAVGCFVALDLLGYLSAVVLRVAPWWMVPVLAVPLATLLVATRAVTRARENTRRLQVLLDAAVRAQSLYEPGQVSVALVQDAAELLRIEGVQLRPTAPDHDEIGAQLLRGKDATWVVAPSLARARSTAEADQRALEALAAIASDAFARLQLTDDMVHFARHDPLTDLPNRGILQDRVAHAIQSWRRHATPVALLLLDLDGFKPINDRYGHAAGDRVLVHVAEALRSSVRATDTVARLGGDEFAVLLEEIDPEQTRALCQRILRALEEGVAVSGRVATMSASIGVAYAGADANTESLLRQADLAMYEAKRRGKAMTVEYDPSIGESRLRKLELTEQLRKAVALDEVTVVYQPIVLAETGRIAGVEALARWEVDETPIAPDVFIPLAEELGLMVSLGEHILLRAAQETRALRAAQGDSKLTVSVNVSAQQLREPDFVAVVRRALSVMGGGLVLEITEREGIGDDETIRAAMQEMSAFGVRFAIDDFGVGFSSIAYLQDVSAHIIKIDRALSRDIDRDERAHLLLRSIAAMGSDLGMEVVVEGIERKSQLDLVRDDTSARFAQGFFMHEPLTLSQVLAAVRQDRAVAARGRWGSPRTA